MHIPHLVNLWDPQKSQIGGHPSSSRWCSYSTRPACAASPYSLRKTCTSVCGAPRSGACWLCRGRRWPGLSSAGRRDVLLREVSSAAPADRRGGVEPTLSSCASYLVIGVMQAGLELPNPCAHGVGGSRVLQGVGLQLFLYRALHALNGLECLRAENRPTGSPGCNASAKCLQVVHLR